MTTAASTAAPRADLTYDDALMVVRDAGLRLSTARRLVLEALYATEVPVSAEAIADGLDGRVTRSDLASVYRNLETLEQLGLARHLHLGHGPGLYERGGLAAREYLVCDRCQAVTSVPAVVLDGARAAILEATGFAARFAHFPVGGLCAGCNLQPRMR